MYFETFGKIHAKTLAVIFALFLAKSVLRNLLHSTSTSTSPGDISTVSKHGMESTGSGKLHHGQIMAFESEMPLESSTQCIFVSFIDL
jgi:hypothetical protein